VRGTWWGSWLRHCATSWKIAGSITEGVIGIFRWHNPSSRTMALGLTQPVTEMSTRSISWGQRLPVRGADNLIAFMCRLSWSVLLNLLEPSSPLQACNGIVLPSMLQCEVVLYGPELSPTACSYKCGIAFYWSVNSRLCRLILAVERQI